MRPLSRLLLPMIRPLAPVIILIFACSMLVWGQESALYSFRLSDTDGGQPDSALVSDKAGNLYGTTPFGGVNLAGTIFELSPPTVRGGLWSESVLYSFGGGSDGSMPLSPLFFDKFGNLYGTTFSGGLTGTGCASDGCGTVFQLSPPTSDGAAWFHTVLYKFSPPGGFSPESGVSVDEIGDLYGTTYSSGTGAGTVYALIPPASSGGTWTERVLYSFTGGSDGAAPEAGVTLGKNHQIYGTTQEGGSANNGSVFELTPPSKPGDSWTKTTLYSFLGGNDGAVLNAGVILDSKGNLYGTTVLGGGVAEGTGTVFELIPPSADGKSWTEMILYAFQANVGAFPYDAPLRNSAGNLYGTTSQGGVHNVGMVFKLAPPSQKGGTWTFTSLHDFTGGEDGVNEGAFPQAGLISGADGSLYGTTFEGGTGACQTDIYYGCGTVFRIAP